MQKEDPIETAIVTFKMDIASEIDLSSKPNVASELNTIPKIEITSETDATSKNDVAVETIASGKNSVDDASKIEAVSEILVVSNAETLLTDRSSNIGVSSKGLYRKSYAARQKRRHSIAVLDRSLSKHKFEMDFIKIENDAAVNSAGVLASDSNFYGNIRDEESSIGSSFVADEKSRIQHAFAAEEFPKVKQTEVFVKTTSETPEDESSATESEKSMFEETSTITGVGKTRVVEGLSTESLSGSKKRKAKGSLRSSLGRKVDLIERVLENKVERIWVENVEKHTWLQPIETWIADHCRPSSSYTLTQSDADASDNSTDVNQDVMLEPTYDFKFTPARGENEEPKIESRLTENRGAVRIDESKIESKMTEHWRRLRNRATSPKSDRSEPVNLSTQLNKQEIAFPHVENIEENPNILNDPGVLEVKEIKRHDLLDRLKDNVKEKIEDFQRV